MSPAANNDEYIVFDKVRMSFDAQVVYEELSLAVHRHETLTIVGGSGTGKSVLLKLLIGLIRPDSGHIFFDGEDLTQLDEDGLLAIRRRIAILFQGGALFDSLSVAENVAYPLYEQSWEEEKARARVAEMLKVVGLPDTQDKMPAELSGGMKKRVALARALAPGPEVLLLDEPTAGLDPLNTRRIDDLICDVNRARASQPDMTTIVVTHDMPTAYLISDRIAMLHEGRMLPPLPPDQFRSASTAAIHDFVSAMSAESHGRI